jgi:hypothetical protein
LVRETYDYVSDNLVVYLYDPQTNHLKSALISPTNEQLGEAIVEALTNSTPVGIEEAKQPEQVSPNQPGLF